MILNKTAILLISLLSVLMGQWPRLALDEETDEPMLLGISHRSDYETIESFKVWFNEEYESYVIDEEPLATLSQIDEDISIECFMGTWCNDSRREVPRLYKILDSLHFNLNQFQMISVDRDRISPGEEQKGKNVHHVPTIIFYKGKDEIGRIIESPVGTLEEDIMDILIGNPPTPNYSDQEEEN